MIRITTKGAYHIGDALSYVPYMHYLCGQHGTGAVVTGEFSRLVQSVLGPSYQFTFCEAAEGVSEADYRMHLASLWGYSGQVHMAQCFFKHAGQPVPSLPLRLDLRREPCGVPPGIVVSPYSHSDMNGNKFWPHERWLEVIDRLRGPSHPNVYVLGTSEKNDSTPYRNHGVSPYFDQPLAKVLDLISQSPLLLSVDNGISHLAHYSGLDRHVLLYPGCLGRSWADNPFATKVCGGPPSNVQPQQIVNAALAKLRC